MNPAKIEHKNINFRGGRISYYSAAGSDPRAIIFVHGAVGDSRIFNSQMRYFSPEFATAAIDLPGHGKSVFTGPVDSSVYLAAVEEVIRHEGFKKVILAGHSMGGALCIEIAAEKRIPVTALVLISTGAVLPVSENLKYLIDHDVEAFIDALVGMTFTKKSELIANLVKRGMNPALLAIIKNDLEICSGLDQTRFAEKIDVPVLVIANSGDMVLSHNITRMLEGLIKNTKYMEFAAGGHVPFFEEKALFNAALKAFIEENPQTST